MSLDRCAKTALEHYSYSKLEDPETREIAQNDPMALKHTLFPYFDQQV